MFLISFGKKIHAFFVLALCTMIDLIRPSLGASEWSLYSPCIYTNSQLQMDCRTYAHHLLHTTYLWKSIPLVALRVLSCNPLTVLLQSLCKKFVWK